MSAGAARLGGHSTRTVTASVALPSAMRACAMSPLVQDAADLPARRAMRVDFVEALRYE